MIREPISNKSQTAIMALSIAVCVLLYSWLSYHQKVINPKDTTIPNLIQFFEGIKLACVPNEIGEIWLLEDMEATFFKHFLGMACGVVLSLAVGVGMGCFPTVESFFKLPVSLLSRIPPTAMIAIYFALFGLELKMFVAMIAFGIFPTLTQAIYQAAKHDITDEHIYKSYTLGASNAECVWEVVLPTILPRIIENVRLMVGPAMVFLIAAEWGVADIGFGYRLKIQSRLLNMNVVYFYLLTLGFACFFIDWLLVVAKRKLCPWWEEEQT